MNTSGGQAATHTGFFRSRLQILIASAILAALALGALAFEAAHPSRYLASDSFTYFTMARQVHDAGLWYSYSGVDHTTGAHPAYYLVMAALFPLFGMALPAWSLVVNAVFLLLGLWLCYRALGFIPAATVFVLVMTRQAAAVTNNGMESSLLFLALSATVFFSQRFPDAALTPRQAAVLGLLLGAAVMARLDVIFFAIAFLAAYAIATLARSRTRKEIARLAASLACMLAPLCALVGLVFLIDLHYDGTLIPLSGGLKSSFPHLTPFSFYFDSWQVLAMFIVSIFTTGGYIAWRIWTKRRVGILIPSLFVSCALLFLYDAAFVFGIGVWYGVFPFFAFALVAGLFVRDLFELIPERLSKFRAPLFLACLAIASATAIATHVTQNQTDWLAQHERAAAYLASIAKPGEAAAEFKDGVFAFYSTTIPVYNLTGLGNNLEYADALRTGELAAYLERTHIAYIASGSGSGIQVPGARQYLQCAHPFYDDMRGVKLYRVASCTLIDAIGPIDPHQYLDVSWDKE